MGRKKVTPPFVSNTSEIEKTNCETGGQPAGFNEFYHGHADAKEGNPLIKHEDNEKFNSNKFRENR